MYNKICEQRQECARGRDRTDGMSCDALCLCKFAAPSAPTPNPQVVDGVREEVCCLLIRNETVKETTACGGEKGKKDSEIRKPVTPAAMYCFAPTFNNNSLLLFFNVFVSYPLLVPCAGAQ